MSSHTYTDLTCDALIKRALAAGEGLLASNQALVVKTGTRTGRSPKDRFIVKDAITAETVSWDNINQPLSPSIAQALWEKADQYWQHLATRYVSHLRVGDDQALGINVTVCTELAWHALFAKNLFLNHEQKHKEEWTLLCVPHLALSGAEDGINSDAVVVLDFTQKRVLICGTFYAGEMKKAMFSVLNFLLPEKNVLPMHCAANVGKEGDTALFFGLSGTGKTTLSADPERFLIGDDEHGWSQHGIFNFEGGCYAKCIDLSAEREPIIWQAIRYGSVIENVVLDPTNLNPKYEDSSITQNTRVAYPRAFIPEREERNCGVTPRAVIFLTCDLYGVLPPVAWLTHPQAAYYFLSGYTALVGSTEVGQGSDIKPTFSTCFGAPFFPRPASRYAALLMQRLHESNAHVYLVNTGWTGGACGAGGKRFSIPTTRAIVHAILNHVLAETDSEIYPGFQFNIPKHIHGVESHLLNPLHASHNQETTIQNANKLIDQFRENFKRFKVDPAILAAGPIHMKE